MWKRFTPKQTEYISGLIEKYGYVPRNEFAKLIDKCQFSYETLKRELERNGFPYALHNLKHLLRIVGVESKGHNTFDFVSFNKLDPRIQDLFDNSKLKAWFICKECHAEGTTNFSNINTRMFFPKEPICPLCINGKIRETPEWRKKNSEAQLIAQNRKGVPERMSEIIKKRYENDEYRKMISEAGKKVWQREGYRSKMKSMLVERMQNKEYVHKLLFNTRRGQKSGYYNEVYYQGAFELGFLMMEFKDRGTLSHIRRIDEPILYLHPSGETKRYFPDFMKDEVTVIEIKGGGPWMNLKVIEAKNKAAKKWCKENGKKFRILHAKDIQSFWIRQARVWLKLNHPSNKKEANG